MGGKPCTTTTCKVATYVWICSRVLFTHTSTPLKTEVIQLLALWAAQLLTTVVRVFTKSMVHAVLAVLSVSVSLLVAVWNTSSVPAALTLSSKPFQPSPSKTCMLHTRRLIGFVSILSNFTILFQSKK